MISIKNLEEMQKYYTKSSNTYVFDDTVLFSFDVDVNANIVAEDICSSINYPVNIKALNILSKNDILFFRNIVAEDIKADGKIWAENITANDISASTIKARDIKANKIYAWDIVARDVYTNTLESRYKTEARDITAREIFAFGLSARVVRAEKVDVNGDLLLRK